jgi:predicted dehydrogenase/nucleoside-diphosphate-sugar epimerase
MNVFVTGGTGFIGSEVVRQLGRRGHHVRCLVRPHSDTRGLRAAGAESAPGDLLDSASLSAALDNIDAVIHLAAATRAPDPALQSAVNVGGTDDLVHACQAKNVRRLLAASTIAVTAPKLSTYARTKLEAEEVIRTSGLDYTILRLNLVYGPGRRGLFQRMARQIHKLPLVPVVGPGIYHLQPVHFSDVADAFLCCLERESSIGKSYDIAGLERVTFNQLLLMMQEVIGIRKRLIHIPLPIALLGARLMGRLMKNPPFREDSVLGINQEKTCDVVPAVQDLGFSPVGLREGLKDAFGIQSLEASESLETPSERRRVGIVGLGKMGVAHAALINTMEKTELVGLMDMNGRMQQYVRSLGLKAPFYTELSEMLTEARPEAVLICTPPSSHYTIAKACVEQGISVLVEKPLAESLESARRIFELTNAQPITHSCGYNVAYVPLFGKARALLRAGLLGDVYRFRAGMYLSKVLSAADADKGWQFDPAKSGGGVVSNVSSHLLFLLHWYFGDARQVQAWLHRPYSSQVEDVANAIIEFESGVIGQFDSSWSVPGYQRSGIELVIEGHDGTMWLDNGAIQLYLTASQLGYSAGWHIIHAADIESPPSFDLGGEGYYAEVADFVKCIGTQQQPLASWYDGSKVQELIEAIYESARLRQPVWLGGDTAQISTEMQQGAKK